MWLYSNVRHVFDGSPGRSIMYLITVVCEASMLSLRSSPWVRGVTQSGFSRHIRQVRSRASRTRLLHLLLLPPRFPGPEQLKAFAVPAGTGFRCNDYHNLTSVDGI